MARTPILFQPEYAPSRSRAQSRIAFVNVYAEPGPGKGQFVSRGYPGFRLWHDMGAPIRGAHFVPANPDVGRLTDALYVVAGDGLFRVTQSAEALRLGDVPGSDRVQFAENRYQVALVSETQLYVWDTQTGVFTAVAQSSAFPGAAAIASINGFGLLAFPSGDRFAITGINDFTSIGADDRATAESKADPVVAIVIVNNEPWLMGRDGFEVWPNTGAANFPFERRDVNADVGCVSRDAARLFDNTLFWLGRDVSGQMFVYRANGYGAQRVSNHAIERLAKDDPNPERAYAFVWGVDGHPFYTLTLASGSVTYDASTGLWHQTTTGVEPIGAPHAPARWVCAVAAYGRTLLCDAAGRICEATFDAADDLGAPLVREVWPPPFGAETSQTTVLRVRLEADTGLAALGDDPQVLMAHSRDGGQTFGAPQAARLGTQGAYGLAVDWGGQGMAGQHQLVFRVTDPAALSFTGGWVDLNQVGRP